LEYLLLQAFFAANIMRLWGDVVHISEAVDLQGFPGRRGKYAARSGNAAIQRAGGALYFMDAA